MIGLVSESLKNLLEAEMSPSSAVTLLSPADPSSLPSRVNLFLYRLCPNPQLRNQGFTVAPDNPYPSSTRLGRNQSASAPARRRARSSTAVAHTPSTS